MDPQPLVLLVEDDPDTAALYKAVLTAEGVEVVYRAGCREAMEWWQASARRPDLLILDMRLPDGDGLKLCQDLLARQDLISNPPALILSAHGDPRLPAMSRQAGARAFLDKMVGLEVFLQTARELLGLGGEQRTSA